MKKRISAILLSLVMLVSLLPTAALATETENVAKIGDNEYATLADAVTAAQENDIITLLADIEITTETTFTMANGVTLDLNGKTLTAAKNLTVTGNDVTVKNGAVVNSGSGNYVLYIGNSEQATSATVENVTINNGGIYVVNKASATLGDANNVDASSKNYAVIVEDKGFVEITGGTYIGGKIGHDVMCWKKNINVTGGTFKRDYVENFVADDYTVVKNVGGTYTVKEVYVAKVNDQKYETLQAAIADANDTNNTVTLLANIENAENITINKSLTLDLGAYTITGNTEDAVLRVYSNVVDTTIAVTINATTGGIGNNGTGYAIYAGQDLDGGNDNERTNLTINGGSFKASGETGDHANGQPVYNTLVLNNTDFYEGVTGSFVINGGKFYMFNPGCMSVNKHDHHNHDQITDGKSATLGEDGWFTVAEGEFAYKVVCHPTSPASAHQHCFVTQAEAELFIKLMGNCKWDKVVEIAD